MTMENSKAAWENSQERYNMLLNGLNELIFNTTRLAETFQSTNMEFAQLIYENGLTEIMERAKVLKDYEQGFQFMHYTLKGQIERHKHFRDKVKMMLIKDPVNCPRN